MALNMYEMWFKGIKIAFFPKNYKKLPHSWGLRPQTPRLWYVWVPLAFSKRLQSYVFALFDYISWGSLHLQNLVKCQQANFDDVIACDLWFRPSQSKILATPINWRVPEKNFEDFFCGKHLRLWSLVLGLGLEHSCPWPWEGLSSERLSLALASDFFCVLGLEPCVLDSTSAYKPSKLSCSWLKGSSFFDTLKMGYRPWHDLLFTWPSKLAETLRKIWENLSFLGGQCLIFLGKLAFSRVKTFFWRSPKNFCRRPFSSFLEITCFLCCWSLALASSIPVLDLERVCPREVGPWSRIFLCC